MKSQFVRWETVEERATRKLLARRERWRKRRFLRFKIPLLSFRLRYQTGTQQNEILFRCSGWYKTTATHELTFDIQPDGCSALLWKLNSNMCHIKSQLVASIRCNRQLRHVLFVPWCITKAPPTASSMSLSKKNSICMSPIYCAQYI